MNANATPELMNTLGQQAKAASALMAKAPAAVKLRALRGLAALLRAHIEHSKLEVRHITLDMLYQARNGQA